MKIQGFKYALWGINFVIVVAIGLSMTLLVLAKDSVPPNVVKELDDRAAKHGPNAAPAEDRIAGKDIEAIWKAQIRALPPPVVVPETQHNTEVQPGHAPPLSNFIAIAGLFADEVVVAYLDPADPAHKKIAVDKDTVPRQKYVSMNTAVPEVKPEAVPIRFEILPYPGAVIFKYDGREVPISIDREMNPGGPAPVAAGGPAGPRGFRGPAGALKPTGRVPGSPDDEKAETPEDEAATEAKEVRPGQWEIPAAEKEKIVNGARDLLNEIGVEDYSEGDVKGIKLSSLGDSLAAQRGFQEGDIVKSVNGQPISSQSDLINWAKKVGDRLQVVRVDFIRQGKPMSTTYHLK